MYEGLLHPELVQDLDDGWFGQADFAWLNKNAAIDDYTNEVAMGKYTRESVKIVRLVFLRSVDFDYFAHGGLLDSHDWLDGIGGFGSHADVSAYMQDESLQSFLLLPQSVRDEFDRLAYRECVAVMSRATDDCLVVDPSGHDYARYVGLNFQVEANAKEKARAV